MRKKRYTLYISRPLANRFDEVARIRNGAKSALVEEALRDSLAPKPPPGDAVIAELADVAKTTKKIERDMALTTEALSLFVRYFLTVTPALPKSEQEPAHILGHERFEVFVAEVGRRLGTDQRLISEVLETIAIQNPDLFATAGVATPVKPRPVSATVTPFNPKADGSTSHG